MKKRLSVFLLYLFYWYAIFIFARLAFLVFYFDKTKGLAISEIFKTFFYGFKLDIAIASYIVLVPSILLTLTSFSKGKFIAFFYHFYTAFALLLCSTIILGDLFMYRHWGFRMDATPLFYMTNMKAMTASVSTFTVLGGVLMSLFVAGIFFIIYFKMFSGLLKSLPKDHKAVIVLLPASLLLILIMRGGIGISSLTTSTAYFSKNQFANHATINPIWNVGFSLTEANDLQRKYLFYSNQKMESILAPLLPGKANKISLLTTDRPNIILIITESLTAKAMAFSGGSADIMPQLNNLAKEGVLFDQVYASSDRTDKGIAAVLSGFPSLPGSSPLKYQKLTEKLAFLPEKLNREGYKTEFYYGGTLEFANYRSYLVQAGFDKMVSDKDYSQSVLLSKWGAFDHVVFNRCLDESPDSDSRFFKTILTLTSHEPFETPVAPVIKGNTDELKFLNSLHYTDSIIGDFIKVAKTRKWWDNTLIIIIADHGSRLPGNSELNDKTKYHIPMIWLGGALNVRDTVITNLACQTDLAATLLSQLQISADEFMFSKNILATEYIPYSFFTYTGGFGFLKPDKLSIYNTETNTYTEPEQTADSMNYLQGIAYLQSIYMDYYSKNK
jgi:phosphoglycerol transferase MdoB-like AlkP superfamily enzyme